MKVLMVGEVWERLRGIPMIRPDYGNMWLATMSDVVDVRLYVLAQGHAYDQLSHLR